MTSLYESVKITASGVNITHIVAIKEFGSINKSWRDFNKRRPQLNNMRPNIDKCRRHEDIGLKVINPGP